MKDPAITEAFAKTYDLANKLAITGTPSYVVGNEVVFGALGQEVLAEKIAGGEGLRSDLPAEPVSARAHSSRCGQRKNALALFPRRSMPIIEGRGAPA